MHGEKSSVIIRIENDVEQPKLHICVLKIRAGGYVRRRPLPSFSFATDRPLSLEACALTSQLEVGFLSTMAEPLSSHLFLLYPT